MLKYIQENTEWLVLMGLSTGQVLTSIGGIMRSNKIDHLQQELDKLEAERSEQEKGVRGYGI